MMKKCDNDVSCMVYDVYQIYDMYATSLCSMSKVRDKQSIL